MINSNLLINKKNWNQIINPWKNGKLPHALLFHGPAGSGKEGHALELAALLNCTTLNGEEPCGNSQACKQTKSFQHGSVKLILPLPRGKIKSSDDSVENAILVAAIAATVAGVIAAKDVSISARMSTIGNTMYKTQIGGVSGNWEADPQAGLMSDAIETVTTATADAGIEVKEFISDAVETAPQNYTV